MKPLWVWHDVCIYSVSVHDSNTFNIRITTCCCSDERGNFRWHFISAVNVSAGINSELKHINEHMSLHCSEVLEHTAMNMYYYFIRCRRTGAWELLSLPGFMYFNLAESMSTPMSHSVSLPLLIFRTNTLQPTSFSISGKLILSSWRMARYRTVSALVWCRFTVMWFIRARRVCLWRFSVIQVDSEGWRFLSLVRVSGV